MMTKLIIALALAHISVGAGGREFRVVDRPAGQAVESRLAGLVAEDGVGDWPAVRQQGQQGDFKFVIEARRSGAGDMIVYFMPAAADVSEPGKLCQLRFEAREQPSPQEIQAAGLRCVAAIRGPVTVTLQPMEPPGR